MRSRTCFRRCREFQVPFSCFAPPNSFSVDPRASGPIFIFCAPGHVFGDSEFVGSRFHVFHSRKCFRWCEGRRVSFSCFALLDTFSAIPRASSPVFMFCTLGPIFGGTEGDGSRFHILHNRTRFGGTEGVGSRFYILRSLARFRRY
jgi:hypothetical protein